MLGKQNTANPEIRKAMRDRKISQWEVAEAMGVHFNTVGIWLRTELDAHKKAEFMRVIDGLAKVK